MIRQAALSLYNSLGLSGEDNLVSRTDNFVIVNVLNSVTFSRVTGNRNFATKCDTEFCSSFQYTTRTATCFVGSTKLSPVPQR